MKKKFIYLMEFLKQFDCDKVTQSYTFYENGIDWGLNEMEIYKNGEFKNQINTPSRLSSILAELVELYEGEISDIVYGENDDTFRYDVSVEIYPKEKKLIYDNAEIYYNGNQADGITIEMEDETEKTIPCVNFLSSLGNPENVVISYDGGGDSGFIDPNAYVSDGRIVPIPADVEDFCYNELEKFGGWEINEGSSGEIIIYKDIIEINHNWRTEENENIYLEIEVTEDVLN